MKVYKQAELEKFNAIIIKAQELWNEASKKYFEEHGDTGSCILGDGIGVYFVPPRCRKPQKLLIIPSRKVAWCQGSSHYEATKQVALDYLKEHGIECHYNYGRMD